MKVLLPPKYIPTWITNFYEVKFSHITPEIPTNKFMIIKPKLKDYKKFADRFYSKSNIYLQKYIYNIHIKGIFSFIFVIFMKYTCMAIFYMSIARCIVFRFPFTVHIILSCKPPFLKKIAIGKFNINLLIALFFPIYFIFIQY